MKRSSLRATWIQCNQCSMSGKNWHLELFCSILETATVNKYCTVIELKTTYILSFNFIFYIVIYNYIAFFLKRIKHAYSLTEFKQAIQSPYI